MLITVEHYDRGCTVENLSFPPVIKIPQFIDNSMRARVWFGAKDRLFSFIQSRSGLALIIFTISFIFGLAIVAEIDRVLRLQKIKENKNELSPTKRYALMHLRLKKRLTEITEASDCLFIIAASFAFMLNPGIIFFSGAYKMMELAIIIKEMVVLANYFFAFAVGLTTGIQTKEYYNKKNDVLIDEFIKEACEIEEAAGCKSIDFRKYLLHLKYFDGDCLRKKLYPRMQAPPPNPKRVRRLEPDFMTEEAAALFLNEPANADVSVTWHHQMLNDIQGIWHAVHLHFSMTLKGLFQFLKNPTVKTPSNANVIQISSREWKYGDMLRLANHNLQDLDLERLSHIGWLSHQNKEKLDLSRNPSLTGEGLVAMMKKWGDNPPKELELTKNDLTDQDLILMAKSGYFKDLEVLILQNNPQLTGRGFAAMIEGGFENLRRLDLSGNSQIFSQDLGEWTTKKGFKHLEALHLWNVGLQEQHLEQIIDHSEWFRNLQGLNLFYNPTLLKFPKNITNLTNLSSHVLRRSALFRDANASNEGLMFANCSNLSYTPQVVELIRAGKAFGGKRAELLECCKRYIDQGQGCIIQLYRLAGLDDV